MEVVAALQQTGTEWTQKGKVEMELDIFTLRKLCKPENMEITLHAARRLQQRGISIQDIMTCISNGEIIEQYPADYPYPSCLVLGTSRNKTFLHVVVGSNGLILWIITAYFPDSEKWESDMKTRKGE